MGAVVVVVVAALYVALALSNGGYSSKLQAAATVALWWAVVIALVLGGWPRSRVPAAAVGAGVCLATLAIWTAISLGWASDDGGAFVEVVRVLGYLGLFVLVAIASPRASARSWLGGLALGLVVVAALALFSRFEPSFGGDRELSAFLPAAANRLSYPIGYWNGLAAAMAIAVVLLVWLGAQARAAWVRAAVVGAIPLPILVIYLASSRGGVAAGVVGLAVLLGVGPARARMLGGLVLGAAGGAWLVFLASRQHELVDALGNSTAASQGDRMLVVSIAIVAAVALLRLLLDARLARIEVPARATRAVGIAVAVAVIGAILVAGPSKRWEEFKQVTPLETKSTYVAAHLTSGRGSGRYQFWSTALDAFEAQPLHGIGAGGYEAYWGQHGSLARPVRDAHSLFIEAMAELGVVGLALILGFFGFALVSGIRRGPTRAREGALGAGLAVLAAGIASAAIDWTWELPACFGLVVVAAALLAGPATLRRTPLLSALPSTGNGPRGPASRRMSSRFGLGVATLVIGWAAIWAGGDQFLTEVRLTDSRQASSAGELSSAAQDARDMTTLQPWASEPRLQLALVEELDGDLKAANRNLGEAIERARDDWQLWFVRARLKVKMGDVDGARRALERARKLNPRAPFLAQ
jgi:O-antigen ligase/polysaccharide polymerase Wzy-like membrane protein/tetratricopeptide repeat protein